MTDHQRARRARKSRLFFAKRAQAAALTGDRIEAQRLLAWAHRKGAQASLAQALMKLAA